MRGSMNNGRKSFAILLAAAFWLLPAGEIAMSELILRGGAKVENGVLLVTLPKLKKVEVEKMRKQIAVD